MSTTSRMVSLRHVTQSYDIIDQFFPYFLYSLLIGQFFPLRVAHVVAFKCYTFPNTLINVFDKLGDYVKIPHLHPFLIKLEYYQPRGYNPYL